jgi:predicted enzyme related to lactoylglutathione lyase
MHLCQRGWFDFPADDTAKAKEFYEKIFGWTISPFPVEFMDDTWIVSTNETGGVSGGDLIPREYIGQTIMVYVTLPSLDTYGDKIREAGGTIIIPRTLVPGMGYYCVAMDTEGNRIELWEADMGAMG